MSTYDPEENEEGGDCDFCGTLSGQPTHCYMMPEHNGVDAYPAPVRLCQACAYEMADELFEKAKAEREHARQCGGLT